ncbi:PrsW family intramembrane metalloprotease [Virgibacillus sp. MSJ-26]|nr:PrsW family intramembrane metalloprotease [Virgibacillus sp. MSJ-26]
MKDSFLYATDKINTWVGEQEKVDLNLKDIFSNVFKKHTKQEAELIFISGTSFTTPKEEDISSTWPKPWLFSRIFITLALTYLFLFIAMDIFQNIYALPGLMVIGSFAVPFSLLIFFWEMNAPQNISFYENSIMFFVGGAASIPATLILYSIFPVYDLTFSGAIIVGVIEEIGKLAIIIYFIRKLNPKYILNGLLIGAAIGAGFAAFESAGYAFTSELFGDYGMTNVIFLRAWTGIGTHTIWSAIAGAALVYVKEDDKLTSNHIFSSKFIRLFAVSMILHAVWDMPLYALQNFYLQYIILIVIGWIFIFVLISAGLKQIVRIHSVPHQEVVKEESNVKMTEE